MSAFGFDPSIILQGRQATLADMLSPMREMQAMRAQQATLADLMQRQQQEQAIRAVYARHANNREGLPAALMGIGAAPQAYQAEDQFSQLQSADVGRQKMLSDLREAGIQKLRNRIAAAQTPEQYAQAVAGIPPEALARLGLATEYSPDQTKMFVAGGIPADKQLSMAQQAAEFEDLKRHRRVEEARPTPSVLAVGPEGVQYLVNPRQPTAPAVPVLGPNGEALVKPRGGGDKALTKGDRDALEKLYGEEQGITDLAQRFKPGFAGKGILGSKGVEMNQTLGSMASKEGQEEATFWADYAKRVDLPERNKTFGSSLTATEKSSWDQAKNIKPGADAKTVKAQLERMAKIIADVKARRGRSLAKDGYTQGAIEEYTGPLNLDGEAKAPGGAPEETKLIGGKTYFKNARGKWAVRE